MKQNPDAWVTSGLGGNHPGAISVKVAPRTALTAVLDWSGHAGVELRGLEVMPGTLEDVFLELTGRELRE